MSKSIDKRDEALKLALKALESGKNHGVAIDVLRRALAHAPTEREQPAQQEPVAWANPGDLQNFDMKVRTNGGPLHTVPLYTSPQPSKPWRGLTPQDFTGMDVSNAFEAGAWWADATLQEKNA